jgi:hypothetical protein
MPTQSLPDSNSLVDLDDLVGGVNLLAEWGVENLELNGSLDVEWGRWKIETLWNLRNRLPLNLNLLLGLKRVPL